jgi:hypothetical protein
MSVFVVEDETINAVVTYLSFAGVKDYGLDHLKKRVEAYYAVDLSTQDGRDTLGLAMHRINREVFEARYSETVRGTAGVTYRGFRITHSTPVAVIKALSCWMYQVSEAPYDTTVEYEFWTRLLSDLALDYVKGTREWEAAKVWR